jgi:hypothetical protein
MLLRCFARLLIATLSIASAAAQDPVAMLPLPQLDKCDTDARPHLPEKWRATYLMAPFTKSQLVLSHIVYDGALPAMRVKLHGVRRGSADLLVLGNNTYVLTSGMGTIRQCQALGDTGWRPLPQDWLTPQSRCTGSAPIGETAVDWWKTPIDPKPASYWVWYKTSDQSPFRLVFQAESNRLPPLSRYALSYQVGFERLGQTDLADIVATCKLAKPAPTASGTRKLRKVLDAFPTSHERDDNEIKRLMPALDANCPAIPFPKWPTRLALTGLLTPFDSDENPYPTEVFYDWTVQGQRTRIFGDPDSPFRVQDNLLLNPLGYNVTYRGSEGPICKAILPGTIRPDWAARGECECAATITGQTPLSPHGTTRILACPLASPRAAWAWYALSGRPTTFMVTSLPGDEGSALFAVLDYRDWLPGHSFPQSVFDRPPQCLPAAGVRPAPPPASKRCSTCHLGGRVVGQRDSGAMELARASRIGLWGNVHRRN